MTNRQQDAGVALDVREHVILTVRQGLVGIVPKLIFPALLVIAPFFFLFLLFSRGTIGTLIFFASLAFGAALTGRSFYIWRQQSMVITNQRIIDVDCRGLFKRVISSAPLGHMNDAYYETSGILQALTKTGNIIIILNNSKTRFEFKNAARPERTLHILHDAYKKHSINFEGSSITVDELLKMVQKIKDKLGEGKFKELVTGDGEQE